MSSSAFSPARPPPRIGLMADDRQGQPDARVAAAAAHWGDRCREWGSTAAGYEQLAESADDAGNAETAAGAWRRAALAWHWGKFVFVDHPDEQRAAHDRAIACYRSGAAALTPPAELVHIPYAGARLAAYLRVPAG